MLSQNDRKTYVVLVAVEKEDFYLHQGVLCFHRRLFECLFVCLFVC